MRDALQYTLISSTFDGNFYQPNAITLRPKGITMETNGTQTSASTYYDEKYFEWQRHIGTFGGYANSKKFINSIKQSDVVVDFGCGGGFLLNNLECGRRIGIEPNPSAAESVKHLGIEHFPSTFDALGALGERFADVVISNNALEHTINPLQELLNLKSLLKAGGVIHFVVPCDSIRYSYNPKDINYHLFSWSPQNLGNLFTEAGFNVLTCRPYVHKWPPLYRQFSKLGWPIFNIICRIYGHIERSWFQVEIKAEKI
jgi:SAM-dependent methyltransferase